MSLNEDDENDKTLTSSNEDDENNKTLILSNVGDENENEDDDETINQNEKNIRMKNINKYLDKIIDKSKSFEEQIKLLKKTKNLDKYWSDDCVDKELKFKLKLAYLLNIIDKKFFKQIFGHPTEKLANKLINTTNQGENQIIVKNINENKKTLYEIDKTDFIIQPFS